MIKDQYLIPEHAASGERIPGGIPAVPRTADEQAVLDLLYWQRGKARALPIAAISRRTGISDRAVKAAVEGLILRHGWPIGSSRGNPAGYYLIETAEELEQTCATLKHQALSELRRVHALQGRSRRRLRELLGQLQIDLTKEEDRSHGSGDVERPLPAGGGKAVGATSERVFNHS